MGFFGQRCSGMCRLPRLHVRYLARCEPGRHAVEIFDHTRAHAEGLSAYTNRNYRRAAGLLKGAVADLPSIVGSLAQNALFAELQGRVAVA